MEDFVPYELSVKLNEVGFNYDTKEVYEINVSLERYFEIPKPTISQVLKWLRDEKKIHFEFVAAAYGYNVIISQTPEAGGTDLYYTHMNDDGPNDGGAWDRYEDAALYCIKYVIDNNLI